MSDPNLNPNGRDQNQLRRSNRMPSAQNSSSSGMLNQQPLQSTGGVYRSHQGNSNPYQSPYISASFPVVEHSTPLLPQQPQYQQSFPTVGQHNFNQNDVGANHINMMPSYGRHISPVQPTQHLNLAPPQSQSHYQQHPNYVYALPTSNVQPQPSYFTPFPEPSSDAQFYHQAPAHIQPLYISQFMFNPTIQLVQQEVPLTEEGNIIVDVPLSSQVLKYAKYTQESEFTHLRYTPLTCSPNDFNEKYTLKIKENKRDIKIAIVCTMYNEDEQLFSKSLQAVFENIKAFCDYYRDPEWWRHIAVVIVSDGRSKINPRTLTCLAGMGCYADGLIQTAVKSDPVTCHMFEYSPQVVVDTNGRIITPGQQSMCPVQIIFLLKEQNAKKINSHRWFFNSICKQLNPEVCMLLDVGTKPTPQSFLRLWRCFDKDASVGGACGEIAAELGGGCLKVLNPLVAAQNFEYKMSNILDKPLESVFGFISVLPGAFSAYRYKAILGSPLEAYFKGESLHGTSNVSQANMYLAEDRILCFEIVAKKNEKWLLRYVKNAKAETDVPDELPELISQRRRWLNGSFFAALHALLHWHKIFSSSHSFTRKVMITLQFIYNWVNLLFTWFSVGNFFLAFSFLFDARDDQGLFGAAGPALSAIAKALYLFLIMATVVSSLGNRPQGSKWLYHLIVIFFALIMALMLSLAISTVVFQSQLASSDKRTLLAYIESNAAFRNIVISLGSTYGVYLLSSLIYLDPWHCFTSMGWYLFLLPSYVNILMIYAFCNIHDTTWGTKGDNSIAKPASSKVTTNAEGKQVAELSLPSQSKVDVEEAYGVVLNQLKANALHKKQEKQSRSPGMKQEDYFKQFRTNVVLLWLLTNAVLIYVFSTDVVLKAIFPTSPTDGGFSPYLTFLFWSVAGLALIRFFFSTVYMIGYLSGKVSDIGARPKKSSRPGTA